MWLLGSHTKLLRNFNNDPAFFKLDFLVFENILAIGDPSKSSMKTFHKQASYTSQIRYFRLYKTSRTPMIHVSGLARFEILVDSKNVNINALKIDNLYSV